ncbi:Aste57867_10630 [Aphanomyces stellatus]|uniref:Aste57867_10630 protein n=1 Tax=Aphanomyces stellatus TaxID=120398 RepID=A0A485KQX5_9STRA|nr:hypothetical protein As57867_010590 [Aphanomyces stellatus]VFT87502.1 Aste57867_10630 [Aphanomyces stellatus]
MLRTNSPQWLGSADGGGSSKIGHGRGSTGAFSFATIDKKDPGLDVNAHDRQAKAKSIFAPRPRRVTSPELIFRGSSLDRREKEELCSLYEEKIVEGCDMEMDDDEDKWHFRPIERPDVDLTSPPTRAGNPVIMDERFHDYAMAASPTNAHDANNDTSTTLHRPIAKPKAEFPSGDHFARWSSTSF